LHYCKPDTIVLLNNEILGKPLDATDAVRSLVKAFWKIT
jgi:predicted house-cleaning NTP pyrophosphatase (Maf/HAM1 superfamily)